MNEQQKILQFLGLIARARKLITGEGLVVREIQSGRAELVILSTDASANTSKKITDKCIFFNVEQHTFGDREQLGSAIGKEARVALAVTDAGFAKKLSELLNEYYRG